MKKALFLGSIFSLTLAATSVSGMPIIQGGSETNTITLYSGGFMSGYDFTATANTSLTSLGFWDSNADGLGRTFQVGLWETLSTTLLASAFIDDGDALDTSLTIESGQYRYETLASAATLTSGVTYTLGWYTTGGPLTVGDLTVEDSLFLTSASVVENSLTDILNPNYRFLETSSFTFPSGTASNPSSFRANVNALVGDVNEVPAPPTLAVLGLGLAALGWSRRKKA